MEFELLSDLDGSFDFEDLVQCSYNEIQASSLSETTSSDSSDSVDQTALAPVTKSSRKRARTEKKSNNPLGSMGGVYFSQRKDGKAVAHIRLPRILKSDVRRNYANMFGHIFNSCDKSLMESYLSTFYRDDFTYVQEFSVDSVMKGDRKVYGVPAIGEYWYGKMSASPDVLFELRQVQLRARSDGSSTVQFHFQLSGSALEPITNHSTLHNTLHTGNGACNEPRQTWQLCLYPSDSASTNAPMQLVGFSFLAIASMQVDANYRIYNVHFDCT